MRCSTPNFFFCLEQKKKFGVEKLIQEKMKSYTLFVTSFQKNSHQKFRKEITKSCVVSLNCKRRIVFHFNFSYFIFFEMMKFSFWKCFFLHSKLHLFSFSHFLFKKKKEKVIQIPAKQFFLQLCRAKQSGKKQKRWTPSEKSEKRMWSEK
jgi:hypothetical protein